MDGVKRTIRNRITRMKIGEVLIRLLDKTSLADIQVATLSKLAGISRMTFYHYYETKEEALRDYLTEIIALYEKKLKENGMEDKFGTAEHLGFSFDFFAGYSELILKLERIGCYKYIIDCVNEFFEKNFSEFFKGSYADMYFYSGGVINVFMKWIHSRNSDSPRAIAGKIAKNMPVLSLRPV